MKLSKDGLLVHITTQEWEEIVPKLMAHGFRRGRSGHTLWSETKDRCLAEPDYHGYGYILNPSLVGYLGIDPATLEVQG